LNAIKSCVAFSAASLFRRLTLIPLKASISLKESIDPAVQHGGRDSSSQPLAENALFLSIKKHVGGCNRFRHNVQFAPGASLLANKRAVASLAVFKGDKALGSA
jgi:hypothetical protein